MSGSTPIGVPIVCDTCKQVNFSRQYLVDEATNLTFRGNFENCPTPGCAGMARTLDGIYDFPAGGYPVLLDGTPETRAMFNRLMGYVREAELSKNDAVRLAADIAQAAELGGDSSDVVGLIRRYSGSLARNVRDELARNPVATTLGVVMALFAILNYVQG